MPKYEELERTAEAVVQEKREEPELFRSVFPQELKKLEKMVGAFGESHAFIGKPIEKLQQQMKVVSGYV